jgi:hypothetical protein
LPFQPLPITLEANLGLKPTARQRCASSPWIRPGTKLLVLRSRISSSPRFNETGTGYKVQKNKFNNIWVVLKDKDFGDLVINIQSENTVYWIHNFKIGSYYQFVPAATSRGTLRWSSG